MTIARRILGVLLALSGAVWMGQGLGLIPGDLMGGDMRWFWIGLVTALMGAALARPPRDDGERRSATPDDGSGPAG